MSHLTLPEIFGVIVVLILLFVLIVRINAPRSTATHRHGDHA